MTVDQKLVRVVFGYAASLQKTQKLFKISQNQSLMIHTEV